MDVHQTSSVLHEMSSALTNEDEMAENVMTVLPIELTNATGTYLQDLNEDCLLEIFSRNPLTPMDLCSLAETCKRFKQITQRMFSKGFAIKCCHSNSEFKYEFSSKGHCELKCTFQDTERVLKNFGLHLSELCVVNDSAVVNLIAKYCGDITLKRLEISDFESIDRVRKQLNSIFQRLLQLRIRLCNLPIEPWYMNCDLLIELNISCCKNGAALLTNTFPILEQFRFYDHTVTRGNDNIEGLSEFVRRHGCLKSVTIWEVPIDSCVLLAISSCTELEKLTLQPLHYASFDISHLQSLAKLKELSFSFHGSEQYDQPQYKDIDFSRAFKSLKTIEIWFRDDTCVVSSLFDVLPQLQSLRELKLFQCDLNHIPWSKLTHLRKVNLSGFHRPSNDANMLEIIKQLINLEELKFEWDIDDYFYYTLLSEEMFSKIVKLVQNRAHVLTLRCHYYFINEKNFSENRKVKLIKL